MATKRIPLKRTTRSSITAAAAEAFRLCEGIIAAGDDELFEESGGRHREYLDADLRLGQLLGLQPPAWMRDTINAERWRFARELRAELEEGLRAFD